MTENERALLRKLAIATAGLCDFMGKNDPFGKVWQLRDEILGMIVTLDRDAASPPPRKPR